MPTAKAAPDKGAAARAESNGAGKTHEWRGITFTLPPKLPGDLLWAYADFEQARDMVAPSLGMLTALLGGEQALMVRQKVRDDKVSMDDTLDEIGGMIDDIFALYGLTEGESEASPTP